MVFDGGPAWRVETALDFAHSRGLEVEIPAALDALVRSTAPAPREWFGMRLTVLWTMFMVGRETDPEKTAVWMAEMAAHLGDLPFDIVAHSIDEAIRKAPHGFIPSVGEIRQIADPLANERRQQIERLTLMAEALNDPDATKERARRRHAAAEIAKVLDGESDHGRK